MAASAPEPGWLPDPWDARRERYWDGTEWAARWRVRGGPGTPPRDVEHLTANFGQWFTGLTVAGRRLVIGGLIAVLAVVGLIVLAAKPWEPKWQNKCESLAVKEGYAEGTSSFRQAVEACVTYADKFGHP